MPARSAAGKAIPAKKLPDQNQPKRDLTEIETFITPRQQEFMISLSPFRVWMIDLGREKNP